MSSNEKFEREFADFLAEEDSRLAALYRKLPQMEPDPRLDGAVRAMAHRALNPQPVATPQAGSQKRRPGHWLPALGAAAGVVFAAGIAFRLGPSWHGDRGETGAPANDVISVRSIDAPPPIAAPLSPAPPPVDSLAAPGGAASTSATAKLKGQAETETAKPASDAEALKKAARLDDGADNRPAAAGGVGKAEKPAAATTQPQAFPAPAPAARKRAPELDAVERKQIMATGAWQNLHDRDTRKSGASTAQPAPPVSDKRAAAAAKPAERQLQEELRAASPPVQNSAEAPSKPAQASPPPAPSAPERFAPPAPRPRAPAVAAPAAKADAQQATAGPARDEAVSPALSGQATQKKQDEKIRSKDSNASLYPEHWLENIRAMLRDNRQDDAVRSLGEFRKMYPDYKLPDDLRDLK